MSIQESNMYSNIASYDGNFPQDHDSVHICSTTDNRISQRHNQYSFGHPEPLSYTVTDRMDSKLRMGGQATHGVDLYPLQGGSNSQFSVCGDLSTAPSQQQYSPWCWASQQQQQQQPQLQHQQQQQQIGQQQQLLRHQLQQQPSTPASSLIAGTQFSGTRGGNGISERLNLPNNPIQSSSGHPEQENNQQNEKTDTKSQILKNSQCTLFKQTSIDAQLSETIHDLECPICLELYKDPRILPCLHTFCLKCLDQIGVKNSVDSVDHCIQCPSCRKPHKIPNSGTDYFPINHMKNLDLLMHCDME